MPEPVLTAAELLAWNESTAQHWRKLIDQHPDILALECDIYGVKTVAQLLQHMVAVETRYAQRPRRRTRRHRLPLARLPPVRPHHAGRRRRSA